MATSFDITPELLHEYVSETREIFERIDQGLVALDVHRAPAIPRNDSFREFHSVEEVSGFLATATMADLVHTAEDVPSAMRVDGRVCRVLDIAEVGEAPAGLRHPVALEGAA